MPSITDHAAELTVVIADIIDHLGSPMDGAFALAQIERELPALHRPARAGGGAARSPSSCTAAE